jgi:hypothetical protein
MWLTGRLPRFVKRSGRTRALKFPAHPEIRILRARMCPSRPRAVGYGDLYPTSVGGTLIGMLLMFVGIGFLSLLTAAVASRFVRQDTEAKQSEVM